MKRATLLGATGVAALFASPSWAQADKEAVEAIVVAAQRQADSLQDVPITVSAFTAGALERQLIENSSDLQLTRPKVTYTKTSFTSSSFTIRGIGARLPKTEFFDLERIEVLRGPPGHAVWPQRTHRHGGELLTSPPLFNVVRALWRPGNTWRESGPTGEIDRVDTRSKAC